MRAIYQISSAGLLALAMLPGAVQAEALQLDIAGLQQRALAGNGEVLAAQAQLRAAEAGITSAAAYPNPELEWQSGQDRARVAGVTAGASRAVYLSQRIENPALRSARTGAAAAGVDVSRSSLERVRADVAARMRVRAYEMLLRQAEAKAAASDLTLLEGARSRVKVRVEVGEAPRFELIKADSEVLAARSRSEAAELNAQRARLALTQLAGGQLPVDFEIGASLLDPVSLPSLATLKTDAIEANPDIAGLQAELTRAQLRTSQERATVLPSLQIKVGQLQDAELRSHVAGVSLAIPLFDQRRGPIAEAVAETERLRAQLAYRRFEITQQLESAWQAKQIAARQVEMYEGGVVKEAESALRVAQAAYRFGERGLLDVLDAQRVLRSVRAELLQARFELLVAATEIDRLRAHYPK